MLQNGALISDFTCVVALSLIQRGTPDAAGFILQVEPLLTSPKWR
jgi:hypothetical protein